MEVSIHDVKNHLSKLISAVKSGEDVIIARNGKPAVKLVIVESVKKKSRRNILGSGIGKLWITPDFNSRETNAEIANLFEGSHDFA
jgi:prevent-host-death family protein